MISDRARTVVLGVVTIVWAVNFAAGLWVEDYKPSESINGIFMAIAGTLFALGGRNKDNGSGSNTNANSSSQSGGTP